MTKILAIESSGLVASVAVATEDAVLAEYTINDKQTHSETLLPMIDEVLRMLKTDVAEMDAIAISAGPGSFTGLRIGAATAKGLGLALDKPLIAVPTVDALAYNLCGYTGAWIVPILDARRNQVYTGIYRFQENDMNTLRAQWPAKLEELIAILNGEMSDPSLAEDAPVIFLGDGVPVHRERLQAEVHRPVVFAEAHQDRQRAASVGRLAMQYWKNGKTVTAAEFVPTYLRLSQAERERLEKEAAENAANASDNSTEE